MSQKVSSVGGSASQNVTRPDDTTAYAALDVIGTAVTSVLTFTDALLQAGGHFILMGASLRVDVNAVPSGMGSFRLHLYSAAPTAIADNAAFNLAAADRDKYYGYVELDTPTDIGDTLFTFKDNINMKRKLATDSTTIYGVLQTVNAFTPSALTVKTVKLHLVGA
jgi:hypothetical protein